MVKITALCAILLSIYLSNFIECSQSNYNRYFACADATLPAMAYGLLEYYNDVEKTRGIGEPFDLKFLHIMMKGFYGIEKISERVEINYSDPIILLAKRKTFFTVHINKLKKKNKHANELFTLWNLFILIFSQNCLK